MPPSSRGRRDLTLLSCPSTGATARASSVLKRNTRLYGPMNALDVENQSSCWNSDGVGPDGEAPPIAFTVDFGRTVTIEQVRMQFQGGFVSEECTLYTSSSSTTDDTREGEMAELTDSPIEPEDTNEVQSFDVSRDPLGKRTCRTLRIEFDSSTDFYGRVTIYRLEVWGHEEE